jgi:putative DNA primase/helicase
MPSRGYAARWKQADPDDDLLFERGQRVVLGTAKGKEGEKRRLVRAKSNIGPDGGGFEYNLEQVPVPGYDLTASCVTWAGILQGEARDLLADAESETRNTEPDNEVAGWLRTLLTEEADGLEKSEVMKTARANGYAERTVQRAREKLGVYVHQTGFGKAKRSVWSLVPIRATDSTQ